MRSWMQRGMFQGGSWGRWLPAVMLLHLLAACADQDAPSGERSVTQVLLYEIGSSEVSNRRHFVGRVDAISTVDLGFQVGGRLTELPVRAGQIVPAGELLAALDPEDYKLALREAEVRHQQAVDELRRTDTLEPGIHISQSDMDAIKTAVESARVALDNARRNLQYTELSVPFDALITRRIVERQTIVQPTQPVLRIQDVSELRVHISVPEQYMRQAVGNIEDYVGLLSVTGLLPGSPEAEPLTLSYREHATEVDPVTQTYRVSFAIPRIPGMTLLPGMALSVQVQPSVNLDSQAWWVPVSALDTTQADEFRVWRYDSERSTVTPVAVKVDGFSEGMANIINGLRAGDQVVSAGIHRLQEGQHVTPFAGY